MLEGPIEVELWFYIQPPKYVSDRKINQASLHAESIPVSKKPDLDNYIKAVLDSSNGILFKDDGQIADMHAYKRYSYEPRIEMKIKEIEIRRKDATKSEATS